MLNETPDYIYNNVVEQLVSFDTNSLTGSDYKYTAYVTAFDVYENTLFFRFENYKGIIKNAEVYAYGISNLKILSEKERIKWLIING